jgi:hypothetical protein
VGPALRARLCGTHGVRARLRPYARPVPAKYYRRVLTYWTTPQRFFPRRAVPFSGFGTKMALWAMWQVAIMGIRIPMTMHYKPFQARPAHPTSGHSYHI